MAKSAISQHIAALSGVPSQPTAANPYGLMATPAAVPAIPHPTACPSWCEDREHPAGHHFGPTVTAHRSPQLQLQLAPAFFEDEEPSTLVAGLYRVDESDGTGETVLCLIGDSDVDLSAAEADVFIAQAQAFLDGLRVLRAQMDSGRQA